jgi:hypothetical protein
MSAPGPVSPQPRPAVDGSVIGQRVIFAAIPVLTCGFLSFVSMLWVALVRRRALDWWLFLLSLVVSCTAVMLVGWKEDDNNWQTNVGMITLLSSAVLVAVWAVLADVAFRRARARQQQYQPYASAYPHAQAQPGQPHPGAQPAPGPGYGYYPYRDTPFPPASPIPGQVPPPNPATAGSGPTPTSAAVPVPGPQTPAPPPRINQVRAELDELSDLLRKEEGGK